MVAGAPRGRTGASLALPPLAAALLATGLAAQEPGGVHVRDFGGELRFTGELRDEQATSASGRPTDELEWLLRPGLRLDFAADVYHPRLLDLDATVDFEFDHREVRGKGPQPDQTTDAFNIYYNIRALFVKEQPVNGDLYAWRSRIETRQRFFATSQADIAETGVDLRFREFVIPSVFHLDHFTYEGSGLDTTRERRNRAHLTGVRRGGLTDVDYALHYNDVALISFNTYYDEIIARGNFTQRSSKDAQSYFRASAYYRNQSGDVNTEFGRGSGTLHLQWLDSLFTEHGVLFDISRVENPGFTSDRNVVELNSSIRHQLYDSLNTGAIGRLRSIDLELTEIERVQVQGDLSYRKQTFFGNLGLFWRPDYYVQDEMNSGELIPVFDEVHLFSPGLPIILQFPGVDTASINVTDSTGSILYFENVDYVVAVMSGRVRLQIPVGSRILPGSTILVDYLFQPTPDKKFSSIRNDVGVRFEVGNFSSLELRYGSERQTLLDGIDLGTLDDTREKLLYARLFQWDHEVGVDWEDRDSTFTPFERLRLLARSNLNLDDGVRLLTQGTAYRTRFKGAGGVERGASISSTLNWQLGQPSSMTLRGEYHKLDFTVDKGTAWLIEAGFSHRVRQTELSLLARYAEQRFEVASDQDLLYVLLTFKRFF